MDDRELLALFDRTVRRHPQRASTPLLAGRVQVEVHDSWAGVTWTSLDDASADAAIAEAIARLSGLGRDWEWKLYSYDAPSDLGARLGRAGLVPGEAEALAIAPLDELELGPPPPPGLRIAPATDESGVREMLAVQDTVFGGGEPAMLGEMLAALAATPPDAAALVGRLDGLAVAAARLSFHPGSEFASFWGTAVLPAHRGRGVFRALVRACAQAARERGARFLQADLNDQSTPILERCGFRMLAQTTPYTMRAKT